jgi:toxin ParE1/3/4
MRLQQIRAFVERDKPEAAERLAMRIVAVVENLKDYPHLGRAGAGAGNRELVIGGTPYIVLYRVGAERVVITTVLHGARMRKRKS